MTHEIQNLKVLMNQKVFPTIFNYSTLRRVFRWRIIGRERGDAARKRGERDREGGGK